MLNNLFKKALVVGITILFLGVTVAPITQCIVTEKSNPPISNGNTIYVGGSGPGNYTKIQDAIDNASDGDIVFVYNGTYFGYIIINKSIYLIGEDKNTTFIIGFVAFTISIVSDWVNISGFTIQNGERSGEGVRIDSCYNKFINNIIDTPNDNIRVSGECNTISGNTITGDSIILSGDSNTISANTITNNYHGIYLMDSCDNIISNNSFFNSGLFISEDTVWNNIVTNNTVNGKPLVYVYDESDLVLDVDAGQIILVNCTNITLQNQEIFNTTAGIQIWGSNTCVISGNTIAGNHYGICIYGWNNTINDNTIINNNYDGIRLFGDSNTISGNTITNNDNGIYLYYSDHNNIINNTITNNYYSILLDYGSDFNNIIDNTITNNYGAIRLSGYNNTISGNTITNNNYGGIRLFGDSNTISANTISNNDKGISVGGQSRNNIIYHNNFIDNTQNAWDESNNTWDDGKYGNYWDDYNGTDENGDGIGDTPYPISGGDNEDRYPLMEPWSGNHPPNAPIITGPTNGRTWVEYEYYFSISDPDRDSMHIRIDWENGTPGKWDGPFPSGSIIKYNYTWRKRGTYTIRAQTMDSNGLLSDWGELTVTMPRNKTLNFNFNLLEWLFERFPNLFPILQILLQRLELQ